ncbi:DUF2946 family protein [Pseudomonas sp. PDM22]|uniref:DUF2946 family protein n=1 Tax=Pseudomonas sp. PDM22 TaxID=2769287 RepID=UPI00177E1B06|nr:DUF2946 domain-containing protein [Pseudomonas sp. PDM22]MBD9513657.1 DUF2946 domain-containing protein [Pseudomonas sp. PDM22]
MNPLRHHRLPVIWMLYVSVLVNLLACGIFHGQAVGLKLSGIDGISCSLTSATQPVDDSGKATTSDGLMSNFKCPVCAGVAFLVLPLLVLGWLLRRARRIGLPHQSFAIPAPRDTWPTANPRASPAA